jgi:hypothetical protein
MDTLSYHILDMVADCIHNMCFLIHSVETAASCAAVGNDAFTHIAYALQEKIDPGARDQMMGVYNRKTEKWESFCSSFDAHVKELPGVPYVQVTNNNSLVEIKSVCKSLGCRTSGNKDTLLACIDAAVIRAMHARNEIMDSLERKRAMKPTKPLVFLTPKFRQRYAEINRWISKENAQQSYCLESADLAPFKTNKAGRYNLRDVLGVASEKYNGKMGLQKHMEEEKKKTTIFIDQVGKREIMNLYNHSDLARSLPRFGCFATLKGCYDRYLEIKKKLEGANCTLRRDSVLCKRYIDGVSIKPIKEIIEIMQEMKFLHTYTSYRWFMYCHLENTSRSRPPSMRIQEKVQKKAIDNWVQSHAAQPSAMVLPRRFRLYLQTNTWVSRHP